MNEGLERPIVIRTADGDAFEFNPPDELWVDMLAFCDAARLTVGELIHYALADFFLTHFQYGARHE